jgi:Domain of Unknown Function (DUF1080)
MRSILLVLAAGGILTAADPGFVSLFNGKDLTGWTLFAKKGGGYVVENGLLVCPENGGGNLLTDKEYSDFVLRLEFKLTPGGNNGVGIRAPLAGDIAYSGMEIQILDQDHERYKGKLQPWQNTGSIYNVVPAKGDALKPVGEWNRYEITARGPNVRIVLNGKTLVDADLSTVTDPEVLKKHPGIQRKSGRVGFLGHNTRVEFRNIQIKEL